MKRIAALAALVIAMIAVPAAAAMASTAGSGPGYGRPGPVQVACHPGYLKGWYRLPARARAYLKLHHRGQPFPIRIACPYIPAKPRACQAQRLLFDMAAGSSNLTEVSGPVLSPTQEFSYGGSTYTIMSVNPGADSFTVFKDGWLFRNQGPAIADGVGWMGRPA